VGTGIEGDLFILGQAFLDKNLAPSLRRPLSGRLVAERMPLEGGDDYCQDWLPDTLLYCLPQEVAACEIPPYGSR
jgi:hypothetical protein